MKTFADRFRRWYDHECDSNTKCLAMLDSVPLEHRDTASFQRAVDKMAHLVAARQRWLTRLGYWQELPAIFPKNTPLADLPGMVAKTEAAWVDFLSKLDDSGLEREVQWLAVFDNKQYRWNLEGILTQVNGHAWYHRGQIAMLVADLGGKAIDTDYVFFAKLEPIEQN